MNPTNKKPLEWTGERYVPEVTGNIRLEHLHRYLIARELSRDKYVLDIACGEGYGSDLLASVATHVVGVDIAQEAVDHAAARYTRPNLQFKQGACESIPLPDHTVDVVVSFETIEHVGSQGDMMREIRRVLRADGLLVISNPERHQYSEVLGNTNSYHIKELYRDEFEQLIRSYFLNIAVAGQRVQGGSIVGPLADSTKTSFVSFPFSRDSSTEIDSIPGTITPVYLLALASDKPLPDMPVGVLDGGEFTWASDWPALLSQVRAQCTEEISRRLGDPVNLTDASIQTVAEEFTRQAEQVTNLAGILAARETDRDSAQRRIQELEFHTTSQAEQITNLVSTLTDQEKLQNEAQRRIGELDLLTTSLMTELRNAQELGETLENQLRHAREYGERLENQLRRAREYGETLGSQFLDANAKLMAVQADLVTTRAAAKAHAATEEWLERRARTLETGIEEQRRSSQDREAALTRDMARSKAHLADSHARARHLKKSFKRQSASLAATRANNKHLRSLISALKAQVEAYERSRSWRLTAPLRAIRRRGGAISPPVFELPGIALEAKTKSKSRAEKTVRDAAPAARERTTASALDAPDVLQAGTVQGGRGSGTEPRTGDVMPAWAYEDGTKDYVGLDRSTPAETRIRLIAFYLPQFHPIPENDEWWGKGFTEWNSVTRAKPQFEGHYQPHLPGELGFYDLRVPEVQRRQIELAKLHGIHGFCFYHYWFQGRKLLQRPLEQFLASDIDFAFCICWANENWTRRWDGRDDEWLMVQQHSPEDDLAFIRDIEPALRDSRCIRIGDRPLLLVYRPALFPNAAATAQRWRAYCREVGIGELYLMSTHAFDGINPLDFGFDAALEFVPNNVAAAPIRDEMPSLNPEFRGAVFDYRSLVAATLEREPPSGYPFFRSVMPMWDNEPRRSNRGTVFARSTPELYRHWLESTCRWTERHIDMEHPLVFVNAWNEWGEGAHLEPDRRHGYAYLQATADALEQFPIRGNRPSIVCVSHDAYFHGAQLIALNLARTLSSRFHYQVEMILCGPGPLTAEFETISRVHDFARAGLTRDDKLAVARRLYDQGARVAICNTSVIGETVELLKVAGFSVISLIHELPGLIRAYELESSIRSIADHADRVVFPAGVVRDRFASLTSVSSDRTVVLPQGLFAPNEFFSRRALAKHQLRSQLGLSHTARVVLAVGYADHRKGLDLFVEVGVAVAGQARDVVFVWVGQHEESAFAAAHARIREAGLEARFVFPGAVRNSGVFFAGADIYAMTSREDPFPSVVVEALDASLPVIGFEGAGGFVELLERGCGVLVPFEDTAAMADSVLRILRSPDEVEHLTKVARGILGTEFSFVNYARTLVELAEGPRPRVSVIVPSYNYARYLPERLQSIINQTYPPHEVLFLDDCSTDNSVEIAEQMLHASGLSYRIIANETNQGTYRQWLRGIREAKGDLVWIAEADDHCSPSLLESLVGQFDRQDVVLAYCQSRQIDETGNELAPDYLAWTADISETKWRDRYIRPGVEEICDTLAVKNTIPNVSAVLMRRIDLAAIERKLVSLKNAGDWFLYVHLLEHGSIAFVPDALNSHRRHASSVTIGGDALNLMQEILMVQRYVIQRHRITPDAEEKRETDLQRTYEHLGLSSAGPAFYKDHETLRGVRIATE
jgi:glycosyltransferase involved in cell wall biosynthesis/SAM-dependent methyltransferase/GT2 family glycosyltransferase